MMSNKVLIRCGGTSGCQQVAAQHHAHLLLRDQIFYLHVVERDWHIFKVREAFESFSKFKNVIFSHVFEEKKLIKQSSKTY